MQRFRLTRSGGGNASSAEEVQDASAEQEGPVGRRVTSYVSGAPAPPEAEQGSVSREEADFDRFGEHLGSVLRAAKEAAARIRKEAQDEAERILEQAQKEAAAAGEAVRKDADALRAQAQQLRSDAEEWARQARTAAEADAADWRSEAQAEARRMVSEAERQAASVIKHAQRRQEALKMDDSLAEDRLRQLATGLHEVAGRLDELLTIPLEKQGEEGPAADEGSIVEVLAPSRETEEATT
jgi:cell division septum initiation protein DivIVA